jgi:Xaa-Pro aminopeptidase
MADVNARAPISPTGASARLSWLPFDAAEDERPQAALRARMEERGLDGVRLSGPENQYYLTGYETTGSHSLISPRRGPRTSASKGRS